VGVAAAIFALLLGACGDGDSSPSSTAKKDAGPFEVKIVRAEFPTRQRLGETTLLRIAVRNSGDERVPALTMTVSVGGEAGQASSLPFGIRSAEPGLAQPDRPVWALSERYPRLAGKGKARQSAGAENASRKSFDFGPLKPGETVDAIWKVTASRTGAYRLLYEVGAGLTGEARAETAAGVEPGGSFAVRITERPPDTIVTDSGEVVEITKTVEQTQANR
jgi:hypothetical protein